MKKGSTILILIAAILLLFGMLVQAVIIGRGQQDNFNRAYDLIVKLQNETFAQHDEIVRLKQLANDCVLEETKFNTVKELLSDTIIVREGRHRYMLFGKKIQPAKP